jgi:osmoprotectant transport system ATP-binding protein
MIEFDAVSKRYGERIVIDRLSLRIERGELFVLVGASGSGKSTLLRMINRLVEVDAGQLRVDGRDVRQQSLETLRRGIGYAIQSSGLFPHWTVAQNIASVPRLLGWDSARIATRVRELLELLQLDSATLASRYPDSLSGGQQQRVGVARALAADPPIVLMDEPFGALDPPSRDALQHSLKRIQRETGKTIVFVTHDMDEALRLGDRIALLEAGRIRQCATPTDLLRHPADAAVREFVGGAQAGLRLLAMRRVREVMQPGKNFIQPSIHPESSLQLALSLMAEHSVDRLGVNDAQGQPLGVITLAQLIGTPA